MNKRGLNSLSKIYQRLLLIRHYQLKALGIFMTEGISVVKINSWEGKDFHGHKYAEILGFNILSTKIF